MTIYLVYDWEGYNNQYELDSAYSDKKMAEARVRELNRERISIIKAFVRVGELITPEETE